MRIENPRSIVPLAALAALTIVSVPTEAVAQSTMYFNETATAPYLPFTGGTVLRFLSTFSTEVPVTLPFPFKFYGRQYTNIRVGSSGLITFGNQSARSTANRTFPSTLTPNAIIAPLWDQLWQPQGRWRVTGSAPQRVMTIQWANTRILSGTGMVNFQVRLYEGPSGKFEFHYGPMTNLTSTRWSASVGYENETGRSGHTFFNCTPNCRSANISTLTNRIYRAQQDGGIDVFATAISAPEQVFSGIPFDISTTLTSLHMNPIGPFVYTVHLLGPGQTAPNNPVWTSGDTNLTPYQIRIATDSITIPLTTSAGDYNLALVADSGSALMETDESNNVVLTTRTVRVADRQPDFTVRQVEVSPLAVMPGDRIDVIVTLGNDGNLEGTAAWDVVLSPNQYISRDDLSVHSDTVTLGPLTGSTSTLAINLPRSLAPGRYYVGAIVDPAQAVLELDEINNAAASTARLVVGQPVVQIETPSLPGGYPGVPYQVFLRASGGNGTYRWEIMGDLPPGLQLNATSGQISGSPTMSGKYDFVAQVTSNDIIATAPLTIDVADPGGQLAIVTRSLLPGIVGEAYPPSDPSMPNTTPQRIIALGGSGAVQFSLSSSPPPGLSMSVDGLLSGVPLQRGIFSVDVVVTDGTMTSSRSLPLTVAEPSRLSLVAMDLPDATLDELYEFQLTAVGKSITASITWELVSGTQLPPGITLIQTGRLTGIPQNVGRSEFAVRVLETDNGQEDTANFTLVVRSDADFGIVPSTLPPATVGVEYEAELEARGGTPPFTWRVLPTTDLPRGMRFEIVTENGREKVQFEGTPEEIPTSDGEDTGGISTFLVAATDSVGRRVERGISLRIVEPPPPPKPQLPIDEGGCECVQTQRTSAWWLSALALAVLFRRRRR